jgi:hypothetical protein
MMPPEFGYEEHVMRPSRPLPVSLVTLLLAACATLSGSLIPVAYAADPAKPYLGMSKDAIVACAGEPYGKYKSGPNAETLTYHYSGAGPVPGPPGEKKKKDKPSFSFGDDKKDKKDKKKDGGWTCTASLVFEDERLARVSFAHKDVRSPYDWQKEKNPKKQEELRNAPLPTCTFSLPNCTPQ